MQDKWKDGAHNTMESGGRKIGENKLLSKKSSCVPFNPGTPGPAYENSNPARRQPRSQPEVTLI